jgi:hypothetical protein
MDVKSIAVVSVPFVASRKKAFSALLCPPWVTIWSFVP